MQEDRGGTVITTALLTKQAVAIITGYFLISTILLKNAFVKSISWYHADIFVFLYTYRNIVICTYKSVQDWRLSANKLLLFATGYLSFPHIQSSSISQETDSAPCHLGEQ